MEETSLLIPRCEVYWGNQRVSPAPVENSDGSVPDVLVYDVNVSIQETGQTPSGSMKWDPTGLGFSLYEEFLREALSETITVRYHYIGGRSIFLSFVWSGHVENYGNDMSIEVKLASEVDGLVNANIKSTAKVDDKGAPLPETLSKLSKSFGIDGIAPTGYTPQAKENLAKGSLVTSSYSEGTNWAETSRSLVEESGHLLSFLGIRNPADPQVSPYKSVVFGPYKTDKTPVQELSPTSQYPDPEVRYGYFLGPGIINTLQKTSEWQQPQKNQTPIDNSQQKLPTTGNKAYASESAQPKPTRPQESQQQARDRAAKAAGASGTGKKGRAGSRIEKNQLGEENKKALQEERASKLSATVFMCPAITGIKPNDVVFVPSYKGDFMEDWIVTGVEYSQTDGGVEVSIQASREYGLGNLMNPTLGEPWRIRAFEKGLVGPSASLENWTAYAWNIPVAPVPLPEGVAKSAAPLSSRVGTPKQRALLDAIAFAEGTDRNQTGGGYGVIFGGGTVPELESGQLSVRQVYDMMQTGTLNGRSVGYAPGSSATGRYQLMPGTLSDLVKQGATTWDAKFTPELQDSLILTRMETFRGVSADLLEREGFSQNVSNKLAPEFASLPTYSGRSYYGQPVKRYSDVLRVFNSSLSRNPSPVNSSILTSPPPGSSITPLVTQPYVEPTLAAPVASPSPQPSIANFTEIVVDGRPATRVNDLSFVEYIRRLQLPTRGNNEVLLTPDVTKSLYDTWSRPTR
jgi:muramidase (phage lysozyme)